MPTLPSFDLSFWALQTAAMLFTALLIPRFQVHGPIPAFALVFCLTIVNAKIWDAALFFQIPDHISTQVFTLLIANGVIFWILVKLLPGVEVEGFLPALLAPVVFTICTVLVDEYGRNIDWAKVWQQAMEFINSIKSQVQPGVSSHVASS